MRLLFSSLQVTVIFTYIADWERIWFENLLIEFLSFTKSSAIRNSQHFSICFSVPQVNGSESFVVWSRKPPLAYAMNFSFTHPCVSIFFATGSNQREHQSKYSVWTIFSTAQRPAMARSYVHTYTSPHVRNIQAFSPSFYYGCANLSIFQTSCYWRDFIQYVRMVVLQAQSSQ